MDLKDKIRLVLKEHYGEFESYLEHKYEEKVISLLMSENWPDKRAWATYNQVIIELKNNIKDHLKVKELQYQLTDSETKSPSESCMRVIESIENTTPELSRLYDKLRNI